MIQKLFNQLEAGEKIYTLEISTQKIISYIVKESRLHKRDFAYWVIQYHKIIPLQGLNVEAVIDQAKLLEKKIPIETLLVPRNTHIVITYNLPPTVWATTEDAIKSWMAKK